LLAEGADARGADCGVGHVGDGVCCWIVSGRCRMCLCKGVFLLPLRKSRLLVHDLTIGVPVGSQGSQSEHLNAAAEHILIMAG
jgi:hypothetical protein